MALSLETAENAIVSWLRTATGVHVRIANQEAPLPADGLGNPLPYCTVLVSGLRGESLHTIQTQDVDDTRPVGQQLEVGHSRPMTLSVRVQAFSPGTTGGAWAVPLLEKASTDLALRTVREGLRAAGLGLFDVGAIQNVSGLMSTKWEGRAAMELQFHVMATAQELMGYITETQAAVSISQD